MLGVLICAINEGNDAKETPIGALSISNTNGASMAYHRKADLTISIAPAYQNKGYGTEAVRWSLDWAFRKANLHRIALEVTAYNDGAISFYKIIGFRVERVEKESIWHNNEWHGILGMGDDTFQSLRNLSANMSQRYSIMNGMIFGETTLRRSCIS